MARLLAKKPAVSLFLPEPNVTPQYVRRASRVRRRQGRVGCRPERRPYNRASLPFPGSFGTGVPARRLWTGASPYCASARASCHSVVAARQAACRLRAHTPRHKALVPAHAGIKVPSTLKSSPERWPRSRSLDSSLKSATSRSCSNTGRGACRPSNGRTSSRQSSLRRINEPTCCTNSAPQACAQCEWRELLRRNTWPTVFCVCLVRPGEHFVHAIERASQPSADRTQRMPSRLVNCGRFSFARL
jgi:hypothetical protein